MRIRLYVLLVTLLWPIISSAEQYTCTPEKMTGVAYEPSTKTWEGTNFTVDFKYIISPSPDKKKAFVVTKVGDGETRVVGECEKGFSKKEFLECQGFELGDLKFNKKNGRYLSAFVRGYYLVGSDFFAMTDSKSGTPYIQIGKCTLSDKQ